MGLVVAVAFGRVYGNEILVRLLAVYLACGSIVRGALLAIGKWRHSELRFAATLAFVTLISLAALAAMRNYFAPFAYDAPAHSPEQIIRNALSLGVGLQLRTAGASYGDLDVKALGDGKSDNRFRVLYRDLCNFKGPDGSTPPGNGYFDMQYIGGGQWRGLLSGAVFTVTAGSIDKIDLPFVDDSALIGQWRSVDFVSSPNEFSPAKRAFSGELSLNELTFLNEGKTSQALQTWTKGFVIHSGDKTASRYEIRRLGSQDYLFLEWKSGDVTIAGMKPHYYVLAKK